MDAVYELLLKHHHSPKPSGRDYLIKCVNPEHDDSNPSFRVDKETGIAHCFACGFKVNMFRFHGILTTPSSIKVNKLRNKIRDLRKVALDLERPKGWKAHNEPIRGISAKTLRKFGAFTSDKEEYVDRLLFPIEDVRGITCAFIGRHFRENVHPKYKVYPEAVQMPLLPAKLASPSSYIVLVEGIFDMLNLWDKGMETAVCCFGVSAVTKNNARDKLLPYKAQGVNKIYIIFDGDEAGRKASAALVPILEDEGFVVEEIHLEDGDDPGGMPLEDVEQLIRMMDVKTEASSDY